MFKKSVAAMAVLWLAGAGMAQAQGLSAVGPIVTTGAGTGFPQWVQDSAGNAVALGTVAVDGALTTSTPVIAGNAVSAASGFGDEGFYWMATATMDLNATNQALVVMAVEAAYASGAPLDGQQMLFARTRVRIDCPVAGTYRVTYPYGVKIYHVATPGRRAINDTIDIAGITPNFAPMLAANPFGPLLTATNAPAGYMGDAVTPVTVTGSPLNTNLFRVQGPGINVQTTLFVVEGKIFVAPPGPDVPPTPLANATAAVSATPAVATIDVFATTTPGTVVIVSGTGLDAPVNAVVDSQGKCFARVKVTQGKPIPATLTLTARSPGLSDATGAVVPVCTIDVGQAAFVLKTGTLTVRAKCSISRPQDPSVLTVVGFGNLVKGKLIVKDVKVPPQTITVVGGDGASITVPVKIR